jgi:nicotinamide-nucleotide amidase
MKIAVLTIGDELLNGEVVDTNTADIAQALRCAGYGVNQAVTVGDDTEQIAAMLQHLSRHNSAVIVCGGLGPTRDDVTARAAAVAFHLSLALNDTALGQIEDFFQRAGQPCPAGNDKQALIPHKAKIMHNQCGTAPGFIIRHNNCLSFFMPGVPHEMREMLKHEVLPTLQRLHKPQYCCAQRVLKVFGLAENSIEQQLRAVSLPAEVQISFRLEFPLVLVKLNSSSLDEAVLDAAEQQVRTLFGAHVVTSGEQTLPEVVSQALILAETTLALAESCTGGLIAKLLTDYPGSSAYLERGVVSYANSAKHDLLGVSEQLLLEKGAVSPECAIAMAQGVRRSAKTALAVAVTGIAGPGGGSADKPCGTVFIAVDRAQGCEVRECHFSGDRQQVRTKTAYTAIDWLRQILAR